MRLISIPTAALGGRIDGIQPGCGHYPVRDSDDLYGNGFALVISSTVPSS